MPGAGDPAMSSDHPQAGPGAGDARESARLRRELAAARSALARAERDRAAMLSSRSWRVTGFLRRALQWWSDLRGRAPAPPVHRLARLPDDATPPVHPDERLLFVDVTELAVEDHQGGVQRVVKAILAEWLAAPRPGWRVVPVRLAAEGAYMGASDALVAALGNDLDAWAGRRIEAAPGDVFLGLDLVRDHAAPFARGLQALRAQGARIWCVVYDLLPIDMPACFPAGIPKAFAEWLEVVQAHADGVACISTTVAERFRAWSHGRDRAPVVVAFPLGADPMFAPPQGGRSGTHVLMVGTVEPRKGYADALDACERLWATDHPQLSLWIVGRQGWASPALVARLRRHPELGRRLHWIERAEDADVARHYASADVLLGCSLGEGFGLPLVEAARHGVPLVLRDLPEFREVAGEHALYFPRTGGAADIETALRAWLAARDAGHMPAPPPTIDWSDSAAALLDAIDPTNHTNAASASHRASLAG